MSDAPAKSGSFHPENWPIQLGMAILRRLIRLPWETQMKIGRAIGWIFFHIIRFRRRVILANLKLCYPEKTPRERRRLALAHCQAMGIGILETGMAWWAPDDRLQPFEIEGREYLDQAAASGKGALLLNAHFTTLEICGRYLCDHFRIGCLFRDPDNELIASEMRKRRSEKMSVAVPVNDLRGLIRALREGHIIWYAPDQVRRSKKFSTIVPFFGVPARTNTATSRITQMTGVPVIPFFGFRKPDGTYKLTVLPPLEDFPTADENADATRINLLIEDQIRHAPEQYFWIHKRFKRRGKGLKNVYGPKKRPSGK